ncbi:MAG: hypothetical protein EOP54_03335 [Sphingobacteriales bacterium]|nr:MAG: hypothetical protein EOP54_03335 [Sphingobacteriales bacterium]
MKTLFLSLLFTSNLIQAQAQSRLWDWDDIDLSWSDFSPRQTMPDQRTASIYVHNAFGWESSGRRDQVIIQVRSELTTNREQSSVKASFIKNASREDKQALLKHEKGHLVIAYLKQYWLQDTLLRAPLTLHNYKAEIRNINNYLNQKADALNMAYDKETRHSIIEDAQKAWEDKLLGMLNQYRQHNAPLLRLVELTLYVPGKQVN